MSSELEIGQKFGYWQIIELNVDGKIRQIRCLCTGCNVTTRIRDKFNLLQKMKKGINASCGCKGKEAAKQTMLLKYGVENFNQTEASRLRLSQSKKALSKDSKKSMIKVGARYGNLVVLSTETEIGKPKLMKCLCDCGNEKAADYVKLLNNEATCCGCRVIAKTKATHLLRYGVESYTQTDEFKQKSIVTNRVKYGADYHTQTEQGKAKVVIASKLARQESGNIRLLSNGKSVMEICREYNVPSSFATIVFNQEGEESFLKYCQQYDPKSNVYYTTESRLISILKDALPDICKYDKQPIEFKTPRRPDFRLVYGSRTIYINTDGLDTHRYDGLSIGPNKSYHQDLYNLFTTNNSRILQFREDELRDKSAIVKSIILNSLGMQHVKYNARQLLIKAVNRSDANAFFLGNHLMGPHSSATAFGLYQNDQLLSLMSVRYMKKDHSLEISRFASLLNVSVRGGFTKLLQYCINIYKPTRVISYCDLRYATGDSYIKAGFVLESTTLGFQWTDKRNTYNRLRCRNNMDSRSLTEAEYAEELGWYKIYDAGQAKYIKDIK